MKRALLSVLFTTIVAAFQGQLAAAVVVSEDVPVSGGTAAFAQAAGISPPPDRARFVAELARVLYDEPEGRRPAADALVRRLQAEQAPGSIHSSAANQGAISDLVPVPLTAAIWSDAVFHRRVAAANLVSAILADRPAAMLCHGLAALDDQTLSFFVEHPVVLSRVYADNAAVFGAFGDSLHIRDGRVRTPGGDAAAPLWEAVVGEPVTRPDRFVRALFAHGEGRLAYLYDAIAQLDAPHAAFALGLWMRDAPVRVARFRALAAVNDAAYHEWHPKASPFARPIFDIASLLRRVQVAPDGSAAAPADRGIWTAAFESGDLPDEEARKIALRAAGDPVDAAWLAKTIAAVDVQQRGDRLDQFSFGQRVFAAVGRDDGAAMLVALRAFGRYRMLMLTLDRIGIVHPAAYVAAARHASRLASVDRRRGFAAIGQFQSVVALVARMARVRTIDPAAAEALIVSLSAVPVGAGGYDGGVLRWIDRELRPLAGDDVESGLIRLLAGPRPLRTAPVRVIWEGQRYRLDLAAGEERRLRLVREKQRGAPLDVALDLEAHASRLSAGMAAPTDLASAIASLTRDAIMVRATTKGAAAIDADGVTSARDPHEIIAAAIDELVKEKKPSARRLARIVEPLTPAAEAIGADALLSLTYAVDLGDPDGAALLAGNVALRHNFGIELNDVDARTRAAWSAPRQDVLPGVPWHITGSALGLDVTLAALNLRRLDSSRIDAAPTLNSNERQAFAVSVALMNPAGLTDADRDAIADAIARGRARVSALSAATLDAAADDVALDGWRRRAVRWSLAHDPARAATMFSLAELLALGGAPSPARLDAWGTEALVSAGCWCTRFRTPAGWWGLVGRPQLGLLAGSVADLNLHVAVTLRELGLPSGIARHVLSAAVQDYIDDVRPIDNDDWLTLVRTAQAIPRERIEDYVAAITAGGPLVPDNGDGSPFIGGHPMSQAIEEYGFAGQKRGQASGISRGIRAGRK